MSVTVEEMADGLRQAFKRRGYLVIGIEPPWTHEIGDIVDNIGSWRIGKFEIFAKATQKQWQWQVTYLAKLLNVTKHNVKMNGDQFWKVRPTF